MSVGREQSRADRTLLIDVCKRYYLEEQSKIEIADALGISRFRVARLITSARSQGLVQIRIGDDAPATPMGRELKEAYGLEFAEVVDGSFSTERGLWDGLGRTAAFLLERILTDRDIVVSVLARGLSTSTTIAEFMTVSPEVCNENDETAAVAARMRNLAVRRLVVVNDDRRLVGIVSLVDIPAEPAVEGVT